MFPLSGGPFDWEKLFGRDNILRRLVCLVVFGPKSYEGFCLSPVVVGGVGPVGEVSCRRGWKFVCNWCGPVQWSTIRFHGSGVIRAFDALGIRGMFYYLC